MTRRTVVSGGDVVDGTGAARRQVDLLLVDDRIDAVVAPGKLDGADARHVDASGLVVAPGFIDVHSHADGSFLLDGDVSKILQGVTSEIVGNCGASLAPLGATASHPSADRLLGDGAQPSWRNIQELVESAQERRVTHIGTLVGHGTLRELVGGHATHTIDDHQLTAMRRALTMALEAGAFGLSSGLVYAPGVFAPESELTALIEVLGANHVYATHLRNESDRLLESIEETVRTTAASQAHVQVSHLKATGRRNHGRTRAALERLDRARDDGRLIGQDVYPYTAASTALTACLPPWALAGGTMAVLARLGDSRLVARLRDDVESAPPHAWENPVASAGWDGVVLAGTASGLDEGLSLATIAAREDVDPFEALVHVLRRESGRASMVEHSMSEDDVEQVLRHPHTVVASDGLPTTAGSRPHPRLHGTFPRLLGRYVRERGVLDLESAVHRITGLPARTYHVRDRGTICRGAVADLVAFDPETITDHATYENPTVPPTGIAWVMQNGRTSVTDGQWLGRRHGQHLTPHP